MLTYKGHVECVCAWVLSPVRLLSTPWAVAHQAPLSVGFPRQEYWSRLPFPPPGELPDPGIKLSSPELQANSLPTEPPGKPCRDDMSPLNKHLACVSWERVPMYLSPLPLMSVTCHSSPIFRFPQLSQKCLAKLDFVLFLEFLNQDPPAASGGKVSHHSGHVS